MEIRGHDNCPFCRCEPMSAVDELAKLEHWAAKDSAAAVCQLGRATAAATSASTSTLRGSGPELGDERRPVDRSATRRPLSIQN